MKSTTPTQAKLHQKSSLVPKDWTIMKTNLKRHYRLKGEFLAAVLLQRVEEWEITKSDATTMVVDMFLYWEQDAEFQAWKMCGGYEEFLQYLYKLRCRWERDHPENTRGTQRFPVSSYYRNSLEALWIARKDQREKEAAEAAAEVLAKVAAREAKAAKKVAAQEAKEVKKAAREARDAKKLAAREAKESKRASAVKENAPPAETSMNLPSEDEANSAGRPTGAVRSNARHQRVAARNSTQ